LERADVRVLAGDVAEPILRVSPHELALERFIPRRLFGVGAQEIAHGHVPKLVIAAGGAQMQVMGPGSPGGLGEQVEIRRVRVGHEEISKALERLDVGRARLDGRHRHLKVEDRLRGQPGDGRGADVFGARRQGAEGLLDATQLGLGPLNPLRVVIDDADGGVKAVVE
jgi:hypothetical protein